jgi:hypothetical protein
MTPNPNRQISPLLEHRLRTSPRRRYPAAWETVTPGAAKLEIWAPLIGFQWTGEQQQITDDTAIRLGAQYQNYSAPPIASLISSDEEMECREARHWLWFTRSAQSALSAAANMNAFLFSLWTARPTPTYVRLPFHCSETGDHAVVRVWDRFTWIGPQVVETVRDTDLVRAGRILPAVRQTYLETERLRNALTLTVRGCTAADWRVAFLSFTAAASDLLRYTDRGSLARRISKAYAALIRGTDSDPQEFAVSQERFEYLLRRGAEIFEGRDRRDRSDSATTLEDLGHLSDAMRKVWRTVLEATQTAKALEGTDRERARFFATL